MVIKFNIEVPEYGGSLSCLNTIASDYSNPKGIMQNYGWYPSDMQSDNNAYSKMWH